MAQREGFIRNEGETLVHGLRKASYELRQSSMEWSLHLRSFLLEYGCGQSAADSTLYT